MKLPQNERLIILNNIARKQMELLKNNIKVEEIAIKNYKDIIKYANDEIITDIINRIILDEEHHIKIFKSILKNLV